jgi:hypothetical protein
LPKLTPGAQGRRQKPEERTKRPQPPTDEHETRRLPPQRRSDHVSTNLSTELQNEATADANGVSRRRVARVHEQPVSLDVVIKER